MFKKFLLAVLPLALMTLNAWAADDVLSDVASLKASSISDASISIEDGSGANLDVDALASDAGKSGDAIEACFRHFGGCGYGSYGCGYNYGCYNSCYSPCYYSYSTYCAPTYYCYRPVYYTPCYTTYCYPTYSYWGCY